MYKRQSEDRDGDGLLDEKDACPDVPGPVENKGCPLKDRDRDGILDDQDKCPDDPEDKDGYQDEDGCPDPDNDGDGILDKVDQCPDLPETKNGYKDDDGCPDINPDLVVVNRDLGKIEIKQKVYFDTGKATIQDRSFPLLDEVAQVLARNPQLTKVVVEGHTDSTGSARLNTKLSADRAKAVAAYLVGKGTDAARLDSKGFGSSRPVGDNQTAAGRDSNRRVEFTIP